MVDLKRFVDSLGPLSIGKDGAAVAIASICCDATLTERERCAAIIRKYIDRTDADIAQSILREIEADG